MLCNIYAEATMTEALHGMDDVDEVGGELAQGVLCADDHDVIANSKENNG